MLASAPSRACERTLDNGLRVVIVPAAPPVVSLMVLYRIGSRNEAVGYTGSAHLLEHMLFKGTPDNNRSNGRAFAGIMNEIGANTNATTWLDRTNYFETVPLEFLDLAIELEADRMRNAFIADADRRAEMTVVRNELERNDNDPMRVLHAATVAAAFREHPYHHPTIGWRSDVEGVSIERLRALYDTYYRPENATVFVVGDVDLERAFSKIEECFGAIERARFEIPQMYTEEPVQAGERIVKLKRPGDATLVEYAFHAPAAFGHHDVLSAASLAERVIGTTQPNDIYALDVLGRILGRGKTSRLSRALVDTGLALDVSAWTWLSRDPGLFQIIVNARPDAPPNEVRAVVETTLETLATHGPTTLEVERAVRQSAVERAFACDGTFALAQRLGEFEAAGSWRFDETYVERIAEVTPESVRAVTERYLHEDNRTVGILLPGAPKTRDVVPFDPIDAPLAIASSIEAAPLRVSSGAREMRFATRIEGGTLSNGAAWKYVATGNSPTLRVSLLLEAGSAVTPTQPLVATVVAEMLARGTRSQPRAALEERLERAGVRRGYAVDDDPTGARNPVAFHVSGASALEDVPLMLATIAEELREPAFDPAELALVKTEIGGALKIARSDTRFRAMQQFLTLAYEAGDANAVPDIDLLLAQLEALDMETLRAFHAENVLRAAPIVSAAGGLDDKRFAALLAETLGEIGFARPFERRPIGVRPRKARAARVDVQLERKANVDIVIGRAASLIRDSDDYFPAELANGILGQSTLTSRLGLRLRDREGLTYGVTSAFLSTGRLPGPWRIGVSVNPANVERAIDSAREVLAVFAANGPTERELVQQRNSMVGQQRVALATNAGIAAQLERIAYYLLGDTYVDTYRDRLEAVSREEIASAAARYFAENDLLVAAAGTFSELI